MSTSLRMQLTHMFAALGGVGTPHPGHYSKTFSGMFPDRSAFFATYKAAEKKVKREKEKKIQLVCIKTDIVKQTRLHT